MFSTRRGHPKGKQYVLWIGSQIAKYISDSIDLINFDIFTVLNLDLNLFLKNLSLLKLCILSNLGSHITNLDTVVKSVKIDIYILYQLFIIITLLIYIYIDTDLVLVDTHTFAYM